MYKFLMSSLFVLFGLSSLQVSDAIAADSEQDQDQEIPNLTPDRTLLLTGIVNEQMASYAIHGFTSLTNQDQDSDIDVIISSPGGDVMAGFFIISAMEEAKHRGVQIKCFVPSLAASAAFQILLHCSQRYALESSFLLWHHVRVFSSPDAPALTMQDAQKLQVGLQVMDSSILQDLIEYLPLEPSMVKFHFDMETLHTGRSLKQLAPKFLTTFKSFDSVIQKMTSKSAPGPVDRVQGYKPKHGTYIYIRNVSLDNTK